MCNRAIVSNYRPVQPRVLDRTEGEVAADAWQVVSGWVVSALDTVKRWSWRANHEGGGETAKSVVRISESDSAAFDRIATVAAVGMSTCDEFFDIGGEWRSYSAALFTMSQNWKMNRATVSLADPNNPKYQSRISYPDGFFNVDALMRQGK